MAHLTPVTALCFVHCGTLVSADESGNLRLWRATSASSLAPLATLADAHAGAINQHVAPIHPPPRSPSRYIIAVAVVMIMHDE